MLGLSLGLGLNQGGGASVGGGSATYAIAADVVAINTATGNQTITLADLGGVTPKLALFFPTVSDSASGVVNTTASLEAFGMTDGTDEFACYGYRKATNNYRRRALSSACVLGYDATTEFAASFVSFGENSVTINVDTAPGNGWRMMVILIGGDDVTAAVNVTSGGISTGGTAIAVGFEPDLVFCASNNDNADIAASTAAGNASFGIASQAGSRCVATNATSTFGSFQNTAANINAQKAGTGTGYDYTISVGSFSASGFTATASAAGAASDEVAFASVSFGGAASVHVGTINPITGTGDQGYTGVGFQPSYLLMMGPTATETTNGSPQVFYGYADASKDLSVSTAVASASANYQKCAWSNTGWIRPDSANTTTIEMAATVTSLDADGFTLNFTNGAGSTFEVWSYLAIG